MKRATVWWEDAHTSTRDFSDADLDQIHEPIVFGATGWVVRSNRKGITLSTDWSPGASGYDPYKAPSFIARGMIQRIEWLEPLS